MSLDREENGLGPKEWEMLIGAIRSAHHRKDIDLNRQDDCRIKAWVYQQTRLPGTRHGNLVTEAIKVARWQCRVIPNGVPVV